jgi:hypothetical protein
MLPFLGVAAFKGSSFFIKGLTIAVVLFAIGAFVYAGYRHIENMQSALIRNVAKAASEQVQLEVSEKSGELLRQQQELMSRKMNEFGVSVNRNHAQWDKFGDTNALKTVHDFARLNSNINRMLEHESKF